MQSLELNWALCRIHFGEAACRYIQFPKAAVVTVPTAVLHAEDQYLATVAV